MKLKQHTKKRQPGKQPQQKFLLISLTLALVVASIISYITYIDYNDKRLDRIDKQRFETVRAKVETLRGRLQAIAAPGDKWNINANCSQGSVKFQEPTKGCGIGTGIDVEVRQDAEAVALIAKYNQAFGQASDLFVYRGEGLPPEPTSFPAGLANGYDGSSFRERDQYGLQQLL